MGQGTAELGKTLQIQEKTDNEPKSDDYMGGGDIGFREGEYVNIKY